MIWLIGNKGMLGTDVEALLREGKLDYIASDIDVDITNLSNLRNFSLNKNIKWIINCSAYTAVDKAEEEVEAAFKVNSEGVANIAVVANELNARLVHFSTDYVFDGLKNGEYIETDMVAPVTVYGKSKLEGERHITNICRKYFIFRISWLFGEHGGNFAYTMLRLFKEREEINVIDDQYGSPTYSFDLALFIIDLIRSESEKYGIYHYSNEGKTTWFQFAKQISNIALKKELIKNEIIINPIGTDGYPVKAARPANSYMSKGKFKNTFGVEIRTWQNALDDFLSKLKKDS